MKAFLVHIWLRYIATELIGIYFRQTMAMCWKVKTIVEKSNRQIYECKLNEMLKKISIQVWARN